MSERKRVETEAEPEDPVLGEPPPADELVLEVARSRIADALFGTGERVTIGRYQLLRSRSTRVRSKGRRSLGGHVATSLA